MLSDDLKKKINTAKSQKKVVGFTNGCFDLLHDGHKFFLKECKKNCDLLVVGLNSDMSVKKLKGNDRPIEDAHTRRFKVLQLIEVDEVVVFNDLTPIKYIKKICPDVLMKGNDYNEKEVIGNEFVKTYGGKVLLIKLLEGFSTTRIIEERAN